MLIIDDDESIHVLISHKLRKFGYSAHSVLSIQDAESYLQEYSPDLIFLDYHMPGGSGLLFLEHFRLHDKFTPVVMITADSSRELPIQGLREGLNDFLRKPFDTETLLLTAERALAQAAVNRQHVARLAAERSNQLKSIFFAAFSHDIRTPLQSIMGFADMIMRDVGNTPKEHARRIHEAGKSLIEIVNNILDFSKLESGRLDYEPEMQPLIDTLLIVQDHLEPLLQEKNLHFEMSCSDAIEAEYDDGAIRRVIVNLLGNAIKFSPSGGIIQIACQQTVEGVRLEVRDQGPGVAEENHKLIFDLYGQVQQSIAAGGNSSGLGLAICKKIVEDHGGAIWVKNRANGPGSIFALEIPYRFSPPENHPSEWGL
ncbi:putative response regulator receiver sensor signal transduction histidine kinase [Magnetofaba australis IT-1]|uniref:histidine kinase n=1 Tax=Magnetofaba australis IT-1 TaxID=1434232 RepID=A0A1Y2K2G5_9PROT|nr:putative response regulator receiver sensor signal transduction histidine kinase [Magnetofaba australis IT-1]